MSGKARKEVLHAKGMEIGIYTTDFENEFISLTDIAKYKSDTPNAVICNWMGNRKTPGSRIQMLQIRDSFLHFSIK